MNKENNNGSSLPTLIILAVLVIAVVGGWWLYSSSKATPVKPPSNTNRPTPNQSPKSTPMVSSVPGAQPAHFKGAENAPVVVEEFADFQCPTCAVVHPMMNEITATYGNRIKFIYRVYPLTQIHPNAYDAAVAAEAAGIQGKYWEMQNLLFQNQQKWAAASDPRPLFESYSQTLGLDLEKFKSDMSGMAAKQRVDADLQRARSMNITSTPTILVNGRPVPVEQLSVPGISQMINGELAKTSGGGQTQAPPAATNAPAENNAGTGNSKTENK